MRKLTLTSATAWPALLRAQCHDTSINLANVNGITDIYAFLRAHPPISPFSTAIHIQYLFTGSIFLDACNMGIRLKGLRVVVFDFFGH